MTLAALTKRVRRLQKAFNLDHWSIDVKIVDQIEGSNEAAAAVFRSADYDMAEIHVLASTPETHSDFELDVSLAHELVHVHFRDLDEVISTILDGLPEAERRANHTWLSHEQEGVVDRLARVVVSCLTD